MAVRTTSDLVAGIIEVDDSVDLAPFIRAANILVDECCLLSAAGEPLGYPNTTLLEIETWLAAHFYAVRDKRAASQTVGSIQEQFESRVDMRLQNTSYGQQAMLLDFKGGLAALNNGLGKVTQTFPDVTGRKPSIRWLGSNEGRPRRW